MGGPEDEAEEAAEMAAIDEAKKELAKEVEAARLKAAATSEKERIAKDKRAARLERDAEKARIAALDVPAARSTPTPASPAPTPIPASKVVEGELVSKQLTALQTQMEVFGKQLAMVKTTVEQAVEGGVASGMQKGLQSPEAKATFAKIATEVGAEVAKKMPPPPPYKRMVAGIIVAMFLLGYGAYRVANQMQTTFSDGLALVATKTQEKFDALVKKIPKTQIIMAPPTVTSSETVNSEKVRSVVVVNYSAKQLKVYEIKTSAEGQTSKFVSLVPAGFARQLSYEGGAVKLVVAGEDFKTQPEDFTGGMWVWRFDNDANKGGMRTQDTALLPK